MRTLQREVSISGVGLHNGLPVTVHLQPGDVPGFVFIRTDLPGKPAIPAALRCVTQTTHATTLANGEATVSTTEHLLAALWATGIGACRIELNGPEVPILDGSARDWCRLLQEAGQQELAAPVPVFQLQKPVCVMEGDGCVLGVPHPAVLHPTVLHHAMPHHAPTLRLSIAVEYAVSYPTRQSFDGELTPALFVQELADARTFTLESWIEPLRAQGLIQGGSTDNAIVLGPEGPSSAWRFPDELVRHKTLDVIGDMALLCGDSGALLHAHLIAIRAGHGLHRQWMEACLAQNALLAISDINNL